MIPGNTMSKIHHILESGTYFDCYGIGQVLSVGGFGITYKDYDHTLSCDVAINVIRILLSRVENKYLCK